MTMRKQATGAADLGFVQTHFGRSMRFDEKD